MMGCPLYVYDVFDAKVVSNDLGVEHAPNPSGVSENMKRNDNCSPFLSSRHKLYTQQKF